MTDIRDVMPGTVWQDKRLGTQAVVVKVLRETVYYEIDGRPHARDVYSFIARYEESEDE
jgi:hypothetical protein